MKDTKYTFCLPAYKTRFLAESLNSIKSQTYTDFVCIVSDDCSPEDVKTIFDDTVGDDTRFIYRRNEENMGSKSLVAHWNLLVDMCDTDYLVMASDDDIYASTFMEEVNILLSKYPDIDMVRARIANINAEGLEINHDKEFGEYVSQLGYIRNHFSEGLYKCVGNYIFRTKVLIENGGFVDTPLAWFSDEMTAIMMSENGCCNTKDILFYFRFSGINISTNNESSDVLKKKTYAVVYAEKWLSTFVDGLKYARNKENEDVIFLCHKKCKEWGMRIYYYIFGVDLVTFIKLLPIIAIRGYWSREGVMSAIKSQIKKNVFFMRSRRSKK